MVKKLAPKHKISLRKAAKLLQISRTSLYYRAKGESKENLKLMELIDQKYTEDPTYGVRRMREYLQEAIGKKISLKRVRRLMRKMELKAIYPTPKTTATHYINLLKEKNITKPNQVWLSDITYVKVKGGFAYCVAFIDAYSRKIMSMRISNSLSADFCIEAARKAICKHGAPEVIHTDKGKQFVGNEFTSLLKDFGIKLSVSEEGFRGNILIERFWRTYKYECLYLWDKMDLKEVREKTKEWVRYYNKKRHHQALGYRTPDEVYYGQRQAFVA